MFVHTFDCVSWAFLEMVKANVVVNGDHKNDEKDMKEEKRGRKRNTWAVLIGGIFILVVAIALASNQAQLQKSCPCSQVLPLCSIGFLMHCCMCLLLHVIFVIDEVCFVEIHGRHDVSL